MSISIEKKHRKKSLYDHWLSAQAVIVCVAVVVLGVCDWVFIQSFPIRAKGSAYWKLHKLLGD